MNISFDHDFKLADCIDFLAAGRLPVGKVRTNEFQQIVAAYINNIDRAKASFLFPIFATVFSARLQRAVDESWYLVTNSVYETPQPAEQKQRVSDKAKELWLMQAKEFSAGNIDAAESFLNEGARRIHSILTPATDDPVRNGIEQMFYSQIVGTWTAFETLAADLWEAALNAHPSVLADLSGKAKTRYVLDRSEVAGSLEPAAPEPPESEKVVKLSWLQRTGYDISHKMGTIHRDRFSFDRLSGIRQAYAAAFSKHYTDIDRWLGDGSLDAVSQVRNVVVHRAGIADPEYTKRAKRLKTAPKLEAGEQIQFDGESFCALTVPMLEAVTGFILAVDSWMAAS